MPVHEFELNRNGTVDAMAGTPAAELAGFTPWASCANEQGRRIWLLLGDWQIDGGSWSLEGRSGSLRVATSAGPIGLWTEIATLVEPARLVTSEGTWWTRVPLRSDIACFVESAKVTAQANTVTWDLRLLQDWTLSLSGTIENGNIVLQVALSNGVRVVRKEFSKTLLESRSRDAFLYVWPDPEHVPYGWKIFSIYGSKDLTVRRIGQTEGNALAETQAATSDPDAACYTFLRAPGQRFLMEVRVDGGMMRFVLPEDRTTQPQVDQPQFQLVVDLGTTTTYGVLKNSGRAEVLDQDLGKASVVALLGSLTYRDRPWIPELQAQGAMAPDFMRTGLLRAPVSGRADWKEAAFSTMHLATPAGLLHSDAHRWPVTARRLKWAVQEGDRPRIEDLKNFARLLFCWAASRAARLGASSLAVTVGFPHAMGEESDVYCGTIRTVISEVEGITMPMSATFVAEELLPLPAVRERVAPAEGGDGSCALLLADLGGGSLDLAGYWMRGRNVSALFRASFAVGSDFCFADLYKANHEKYAEKEGAWLEAVTTNIKRITGNLGGGARAANTFASYEGFLKHILEVLAGAVANPDAKGAKIVRGDPVTALDDAPVVIALVGGGWEWFDYNQWSFPPHKVRRITKKEALSSPEHGEATTPPLPLFPFGAKSEQVPMYQLVCNQPAAGNNPANPARSNQVQGPISPNALADLPEDAQHYSNYDLLYMREGFQLLPRTSWDQGPVQLQKHWTEFSREPRNSDMSWLKFYIRRIGAVLRGEIW